MPSMIKSDRGWPAKRLSLKFPTTVVQTTTTIAIMVTVAIQIITAIMARDSSLSLAAMATTITIVWRAEMTSARSTGITNSVTITTITFAMICT